MIQTTAPDAPDVVPDEPEPLLRVDDVARRLNLSPFTVREMARDGVLPSVRLSRKAIRVHRQDVEEFIRRSRVTGTE
jgi:excisionase family DNA binding protein